MVTRPRHVRPVLGSYVRPRSVPQAEPEVAPVPAAPTMVEDTPNVYIPGRPSGLAPVICDWGDEPEKPATVGRAWEADTFTAPSPGRTLRKSEKVALALVGCSVAVLAMVVLRPVEARDDTRDFIGLAALRPTEVGRVDAREFSIRFLRQLGEDWSARTLFRHTDSSIWPERGGDANQLVDRYLAGLEALRRHGKILGVSVTGSAPRTDGEGGPGRILIGPVEVVQVALDFADGTALRGVIELRSDPVMQRWTVLGLSIPPALP